MSPPWDVLGVGAAMGGAVGIFAGYQLRKLVVHIQEYRAYRISKRDISRAYEHDKIVSIAEHREKPPVIPIKRSTTAPTIMLVERPSFVPPKPEWTEVTSPDRDDVIAALMGAGYKKPDAIKATDACSLVERASGLQQWTIAALRNAHGAK